MRKLLLGFVVLLFACAAWGADTSASAAISGKVLEVLEVETFTYLRLKTKDGEVWAAVKKAPIKVGADVTIDNPTVMTNFESKTLKKTFDRIVFGDIARGAPSDMASMHAGMAKPAAVGPIKVAKASGPDARTVAEVNAKRSDLKGKPVVVRGKVVKFTAGVMGKNWVHLRDGSGSAADGSDDILVTTLDETQIGDVVVAKGIVQTDRDFGSGYSYKVLIEEAALQK